MSRPKVRDGNYNVFENQKQELNKIKQKEKPGSIVTPKKNSKQTNENNNHDAIEAQPDMRNDIENADNRALLPLDCDEESKIKNPFPRPWKICAVGILILFLCIAAAILGYCLGNNSHVGEEENLTDELEACRSKANTMKTALSNPDLLVDIHKTYLSMVKDQPTPWLREYYANQLYSGSPWDQSLVINIFNHLRKSGVFDEIKIENYTVFASLPDPEGNLIQVVNRTSEEILYERRIVGNVKIASHSSKRSVYSRGKSHHKNNITQAPVQPFVAYSKAGTVTGELVHINHGSDADFESLCEAGVLLANKIGLLKAGGLCTDPQTATCTHHIISTIEIAESYNLSGILLYTDSDACDETVDYYSLNMAGDPQTPGYASIDGVWRQPIKDLAFPDIPVQTISCDMARNLLQRMKGQVAPPSWQGSYNGTVYMGRKSKKPDSWFILLNTTNQYKELTIQNVLATIRGFISPRQVIMLAASRNSFQVNQVSSTDALLKLSHPLREMLRTNKWLPKRSITFSFWGGAEFGDIGRTEYMESADGHWDEIIAYLDLDTVQGQLDSPLSITVPPALTEFLMTVVHMRLSSMADEEYYDSDAYSNYDDEDDDDDEDGYQSSGHGPLVAIMQTFEKAQYVDPEDLPSLKWTRFPFLQASTRYNPKTVSSQSCLQQTERVKFYASIMLSLADQMVIQYNNAATARTIQASTLRLVIRNTHLSDNMKDALKTYAARLHDNTLILDHMIDNQMDYSNDDHMNAINTILIQLNKLLTRVRHRISQILSILPGIQEDILDAQELGYDADTLRQFSKLLVSMHYANDLMKTVHFQVISNNTSNITESISVTDETYADLERGWI